jgi:nanoRNase/pAp phosphatase (c-di-AMP/oligoRNAs hydrolase)
MKPLVIYHKNCPDGFMGLVICTKALKKIEVIHDVPSANSISYEYNNRNVIVIDVAYKPEIIYQLISKCKSLLLIDHHVTFHNVIRKIKDNKFTYVYDSNKSGCLLAWEYFYPKTKIPLAIQYISDDDTGTWKMKKTLQFVSALSVKYEIDKENVKKWFNLFRDEEAKKLEVIGKVFLEYTNFLLKIKSKNFATMLFPSAEVLKKYPLLGKTPNVYNVTVHNGSCPNTTAIGKYILNKTKCDICFIYSYHIIDDKYWISMRSTDVDVSEIAKIFGGGGHKYAAAFSLTNYNIRNLFTPIKT